jgi:hypothetical protein
MQHHLDLPDPVQQKDGSWAVQYETKDEAGKVIATTTLNGATEREVWKKVQAAHTEAAAAVARLRNRPPVKPSDLSTPEAEALKAREQAKLSVEEQATYRFLQRHSYSQDYRVCGANANVMRDYLETHGLEWTADNLEEAFQKLSEAGKLAAPAPQAVEAVPVVVEEPKIEVPWEPNPLTSKADIKGLGRSYTEFMLHKNPMIRAEFKRQVDAVLTGAV